MEATFLLRLVLRGESLEFNASFISLSPRLNLRGLHLFQETVKGRAEDVPRAWLLRGCMAGGH